MKRSSLPKHLRRHGCVLKREDASHSLWINPSNGEVEAVPRQTEIKNQLANPTDEDFRKLRRSMMVMYQQTTPQIARFNEFPRQFPTLTRRCSPDCAVSNAELMSVSEKNGNRLAISLPRS